MVANVAGDLDDAQPQALPLGEALCINWSKLWVSLSQESWHFGRSYKSARPDGADSFTQE